MDGGAGNDMLVWNNGDGSDTMDGDAGADEVEVNGAPTAGDVFTHQARSAARVRLRPHEPRPVQPRHRSPSA